MHRFSLSSGPVKCFERLSVQIFALLMKRFVVCIHVSPALTSLYCPGENLVASNYSPFCYPCSHTHTEEQITWEISLFDPQHLRLIYNTDALQD